MLLLGELHLPPLGTSLLDREALADLRAAMSGAPLDPSSPGPPRGRRPVAPSRGPADERALETAEVSDLARGRHVQFPGVDGGPNAPECLGSLSQGRSVWGTVAGHRSVMRPMRPEVGCDRATKRATRAETRSSWLWRPSYTEAMKPDPSWHHRAT